MTQLSFGCLANSLVDPEQRARLSDIDHDIDIAAVVDRSPVVVDHGT